MENEYKFMFDRRFDEEEESDSSSPDDDVSSEQQNGAIPSISQLLDSINEQIDSLSDQNRNFQQEIPEDLRPSAANEEDFQGNAAHPPFPTPEELEEEKQKAREEGRLRGMEEGRLNGFEEGKRSAWNEAMESLEKHNSDALDSIDSSLKNLFDSMEQNAQYAFSTAVEFALAVCKKALPALNEANALTEIRALLEKNLHFLKDEQKISLRLNSALAEQIKPILTELIKKEAYHGKLAVVRDDSLPVGDCRVEWKNGGLEKNLQDVLNHTEELVNLYTHTASTNEPSADHIGESNYG